MKEIDKIDVDKIIEQLYDDSAKIDLEHNNLFSQLPEELLQNLDIIVDNSESSKAVLTVTLTSLIYKYIYPGQDIRRHQSSIEGGYSGRTFDSNHITPFLRKKSFPCMAESGWLTRSLEQKVPYNLDYTGAIKPESLKSAFLNTLDIIETRVINLKETILYLLAKLIWLRDAKKIDLAKPQNLSISRIIDILQEHFNFSYNSRGASRLPVLAFYAIYQSLFGELKRYAGKTLLHLENHTSADAQSGRLGDIDIVDEDNMPFEAVEVKHGIQIDIEIVERAREKIMPSSVKRYYILSTSHPRKDEEGRINDIVQSVKNIHGCQIVINGIIPSLKYYLRLLENPNSFIANYVSLLENDESIKFEHKEAWNKIISHG